ncbi:MAG: hypothetical protein ACRDOL_22565 [Streptosporangiaceae bacterium]
MSDPGIREIGTVAGANGEAIAVGVELGHVALYIGCWQSADGVLLDAAQREQFAHLYIRACQEADRSEREGGHLGEPPSRPVEAPDPRLRGAGGGGLGGLAAASKSQIRRIAATEDVQATSLAAEKGQHQMSETHPEEVQEGAEEKGAEETGQDDDE